MTIAIPGVNTAWTNALTDPGVKSDLSTMLSDGSLSYADVLKLLTDVASGGSLTSSQFSDLKTLVANLNLGFSISDYLASELIQIVNGNPANAYWTGGGTTATPLGNLAVGMSMLQMSELIGKWFRGTDLPDPTLSGASVSYSTFSYALYGSSGTAVVTDIAQGASGDCELCSGLIEMVENHPAQLASMIVDNGNGSYGVRFYVNGSEMWETVNRSLPVYSTGSIVYANAYNTSGVGFWADLVEKAYAQLSATGLTGHPAVNTYANIDGDPAIDVLENLTGATSVTYYTYSDATWSYDKQIIIDAVQSGDDVILESWGDTYDSSGKAKLVSDHAFAVIGYDSVTGNFIVRNPWGLSNQNYNVQFEVSMNDVVGVKGDFAVDNSAFNQLKLSVNTGRGQDVPLNASLSLSSLFSISDTVGLPVKQYMVQLVGTGTIALNGAVNLASASQSQQGQIVVSAADMSKLTYNAGATAGSGMLLLSASDGTVWSPTVNLSLSATAETAAIKAGPAVVAAPGQTIALSRLFGTIGAMPSSGYYDVSIAKGNGTLKAGTSTSTTSFTFQASNLSTASFTAGTTSGTIELDVWAYAGGAWSSMQALTVLVGTSAQTAQQNFDNGVNVSAIGVADTAANVFANVSGLQTMMTAGNLAGITLTDASPATVTLTASQSLADLGVLSVIQGQYTLHVVGGTTTQDQTIASALPSTTTLRTGAVFDDFNASGNSDILFRNQSTGTTYLWIMSGGTVASGATTSVQVGLNWQIKGVGDFNTDGNADLLWEYNNASNSSDALNGVYYLSMQNGATSIAGSGVVEQLSTQWQVSGVDDFTGDGATDILFRNASTGQTYIDVMTGSSVNWSTSGFTSQQISSSNWSIVATGDFNGDGKADILWQYNNTSNSNDALNGALYEWQMNGTTVSNGSLLSQQPGSANWQVAGVGDFDGSGRTDVLLRYENTSNAADPLNGLTYIDFLNGAAVTSGAPTQWQVNNNWIIASIGDYNGDGKADILWQNTTSGSTFIWQMNGSSVVAGVSTSAQSGNGWTVQNGVHIG